MVDVRVWFLIPHVYWVLTSKFSNFVRFLLRFVLLAVVASPLQNLTCMYADTHMLCHMGHRPLRHHLQCGVLKSFGQSERVVVHMLYCTRGLGIECDIVKASNVHE